MHYVSLALFTTGWSTLTAAAPYTHNRQGWIDFAPVARGPRKEGAVAAIGNDIYLLGGHIKPTGQVIPVVDWVEVFNVEKNSWRNASSLPEPLTHLNSIGVNGRLYVLGAMEVVDSFWNGTRKSWEYDPITDKWSDLPPIPDVPRGASAIDAYENTIYIAGGSPWLSLTGASAESTTAVSAFNIETRTWTSLPDLPEPRDHFGGAIKDGVFYVTGGRSKGVQNVHDDTFALDLKSENSTWVTKAKMPTARGGQLTSSVGSIVYTFGGESTVQVTGNAVGIFNQTEAYDTVNDVWYEIDTVPFPRHGTGAVSVGNCNFIVGGGTTSDIVVSTPTDANTAFCV
ncbi:hypothetical protein HBH56_154840 [Parastagonospora nodorum]|uniref:Uncharacterized protein n=1 Tax=Phaeosphaeria nodorum (strain SN15 / ATCC MYA-4574 / FGSC 10173) TaxID=321614 RepID=A0A7U2HXV2_PHANO|nr:hypothetical protein HBH56_154840 [Parastagonospora nodorum]QRC95910.1 hypothetical protein JI435_055480 [Parastagonospora nodorum SN15]KAH3926827.1 hypothetical protein HBH54_162850 [Parastagonospora nodorum]KAH3970450.1 hypothetical protein HBH52_168010 [Parastagonospora nodorum]KAH3972042.1 hypothetical protein HBH51_105200 [Parastagonospora nodorum]